MSVDSAVSNIVPEQLPTADQDLDPDAFDDDAETDQTQRPEDWNEPCDEQSQRPEDWNEPPAPGSVAPVTE